MGLRCRLSHEVGHKPTPPKRRAGPAGRRDVIDERIFVDYSCEWGYKDAGRLWISHEAARCSSAACHDRLEEVLR